MLKTNFQVLGVSSSQPLSKIYCFFKILLLSGILFLGINNSFAQTNPEGVFPRFSIYANRAADNWNDSTKNIYTGSNEGEGYILNSSCGKNFLFRCYTGDLLDSIILRYDIISFIADTTFWNTRPYRYEIYDENYQLLDSGQYPLFTRRYNPPLSYTFDSPGVKTIIFSIYDNNSWGVVQHGKIAVLENVEDVHISYNPCVSADDTLTFKLNYHFPIDSGVVYEEDLYQTGVYNSFNSSCDRYQRVNIIQQPQLYDLTLQSVVPVHSYCQDVKKDNFPLLADQDHDIEGSLWNYYDPERLGEFYMEPTVVNYYLPGGSRAGNKLVLRMYVSDSIRFRKYIETPVTLNYAFGSDPVIPDWAFHFENYTVSGIEVWTPTSNPVTALNGGGVTNVIKIRDSLIIPVNTKLFLENVTVEFGAQGFAEVQTAYGQAGGVLKMDNAKLTGFTPCDTIAGGITPIGRRFWNGLHLHGIKGQSQDYTGVLQSVQGILIMENSAEISHANIGAVQVWDRRNFNIQKSGGIIRASDSRFLNNRHGVELQEFKNFSTTTAAELPYQATFKSCRFQVDRNIVSADSTDSTGFRGFISGWAVRGMKVNGCDFANSISGVEHQGWGIYGNDCGFVVDRLHPGLSGNPSTFSNLQYGVYNQYVGGVVTAASITRSLFSGNQTGIYNGGALAMRATYNDIAINSGAVLVPQPLQPAYQGNAGIILSASTGYTIHSNTISAENPARTVGVMAWNSGAYNNLINNNTYSNLFVANLANYQNKLNSTTVNVGLQYYCNEQTDNMYDLVSRGADSSQHGIARLQGNSSVPAGNSFSIGHMYHQYDIYNPVLEVGGVTYYFYISGTNEEPLTNLGSVSKSGSSFSRNCTLEDYGDFPPNWNDPIGPSGIASGLRYYLNDSLGLQHRDSVKALLSLMATPYAEVVYADMLLEEGEPGEALGWYESIVSNYSLGRAEAEEYHQGLRLLKLRIALRAESLSDRELDDAAVDTLESVAATATGWARSRAQAWLQLYDGRTYSNTVLLPVDDAQSMARGTAPNNSIAQVQKYENIVYPNPVTDFLIISWKSNEPKQSITISDITGREVLSSVLIGTEGQKQLQVNHLSDGVYLYHIRTGNKLLSAGKFIKQ